MGKKKHKYKKLINVIMMVDQFLLQWDTSEQIFNPISTLSPRGIFLELNINEKSWLFKYSNEGIGFIQRRTALRRAREIAKVGIINPITGARVGVGFECKEEKDPYQNLPSKVTRGEHVYNK